MHLRSWIVAAGFLACWSAGCLDTRGLAGGGAEDEADTAVGEADGVSSDRPARPGSTEDVRGGDRIELSAPLSPDAKDPADVPAAASPDAGARPPSPNGAVGFTGVDFVGNDIAAFLDYSTTQCWDACLADATCMGAAVGTGASAGKCWLKTRLATARSLAARTTYVRGSQPLARHWKAKLGADATGATIATRSLDAMACAAACEQESTCVGFVHRGATTCELKSGMSDGGTCTGCMRYCNPSRTACP